jgi:superfamily I DNA and/or RNA helicase
MVSQGGSKSNVQEAEVAARVVGALLLGGLRPADIGVVTPYAAQVACVLLRGGWSGSVVMP